ncbi:M24 family metallopeptidase, partial [Candidatus Bathyarchaeota archaeon]|nr:M24 family metallopeptidase [Candidatus Bathyarchaeota archaeon]
LVTSLSFEAATSQACNCHIEAMTVGESVNNRLLEELKKTSIKSIGYDTLQLQTYLTLSRKLGTQLVEKAESMTNQRRVKDNEEVSMITRACDMADAGMEAATEAIRPGAKEYEVAAQAEYAMRIRGSMGVAFETLVASGPRSAFPHGISSDREMRSGEFVTVDLGATWKGYCSDLARTVIVGKASPKDLRIVRKVKEAHDKALDKIRPRVEASKIDTVARTALGTSLAASFVHGLGHGVGLSIHEAPTLSQISKDILEAGNVVTDEPGVYIHGYGGVRTEDTVLVISKGCKKLTNSPYL